MVFTSGFRLGTIGTGFLKNPLGWAWQDYSSIPGTGVTITRNDNGTMLEDFDPAKIISDTAVIVTKDNPDAFAYTGTIPLISTKVSVTSHTGDSVTLNAVPHTSYADFRIYYLYRFEVLPTDYTIAPSFIRNTNIVEIDNLFISEEEFAAFFPLDHTDSGQITNVGTYTHTQIDSHINDTTSNPHNVTAEQVGSPAAFDEEDEFDTTVDNQTTFILSDTPDLTSVPQMLVNGVGQTYNEHFTVSGSTLTFIPTAAGFQLETSNEFGQPDKVIVRYMI